MIENIRKYTGLMIVVLVLLFVGLVFLDGGSFARALGGKSVMQVGGNAISQKEFSRQSALIQLYDAIPGSFPLSRETRILASHYLGDDAIENENLSAKAIIMEMSRFLQVSYPYAPTDEARFITNRFNVQKAGLEYAVTPGPTEVESFVENVLFADSDGNYDQEAYSEFLKNRVGAIGGNRGFNEYIRDLLTAQNLATLMGGGISPEMETVRLLYDTEKQVITGQQIALEVAPYEGKANPTEEELKAFFEENQENYKSDELRRVSYVHFAPDWEATLEKVTKEKEEARKLKEKAEEAARKANEETEKKEDETEAGSPGAGEGTSDDTPPTGGNAGPSSPDQPADPKAPQPSQPTPPAENVDPGEASEESTEIPPAEESETPGDPGQEGEPGTQGEPTTGKDGDEGAAGENPAETDESAPAEETTTGEASAPAGDAAASEERQVSPLVMPQDDEPKVGSALDKLLEESKPSPVVPDRPALPEIPKTAKEELNTLERREAVEELTDQVEEFYDALVNNRGDDFEGIAKELDLEVKMTDFFSRSDAPELFANRVINGQGGATVADKVFQQTTEGDPDELLSEPLQTNDGWIVFRFEDLREAEPLSFEEARTQVSLDLKKKMAREAMIAEAKELHEKLTAALDEGKSFDDAAKELEKEPTELKDLKEGQVFSFGMGQSQKMPNPPAFDAAKLTNPGKLAPLKFISSERRPDGAPMTPEEEEATANRALIIYVDKREVVKDPEYLNKLETTFQQRSRYTTLIAFENWLQERYNESEVVPPKLDQR